MVKTTALLVVLAVIASFSQGSNSTKFGARAGFNMYNFTFGDKELDDYMNPSLGMGYGGGLAVNIPISGMLSIQPELALFWRELFSYLEERYENEIEASYSEFAIIIPVMLQAAPVEGVPFYIGAGIQLDYPLFPKVSYEDKANNRSGNDDVDYRNKIDFGILIGFGYNITSNFGVDFRYVSGLNKYTNESRGKDESSWMTFGIGLTCFL